MTKAQALLHLYRKVLTRMSAKGLVIKIFQLEEQLPRNVVMDLRQEAYYEISGDPQ